MRFKLRFIAGFLVVTFLGILIAGCGGGGSESAIAVPAAPTNLAATPGNGQVSLAWTAVTGATSYKVYSATTPGVTPGPATLVGTSATPSAVISGLTNGTTYYFVVTAVNAGGESLKSNEANATPNPDVPIAPANLAATPGNGQVSLTWDAVTGATSYNIYYGTTAGATTSSPTKVTGATGTSQDVTSLTNGTTYYFVVTAVNAGGESVPSVETHTTPTAPAVFAQADLTGTWNIINFRAGPGVNAGTAQGWQIANISIDAAGAITFNTYLDNFGTTTPPTGTKIWTITPGASGLITETGVLAFQFPHLVLASNKRIMTGTSSFGGTERVIRIAVKQVSGITFSNTDLTGPAAFNFNELHSGSDSTWAYGAGTINASRLATVTSLTTPTGPGTSPAVTTVSFANTTSATRGIVTNSTIPTFHGIMTPDKKVIFAVETTSPGLFAFRVIQIAGQTFALGDLAGTWFSHKLVSSPTVPLWEHSTKTITALGVMTTTNLLDSTGSITNSAPVTFAITPAGAISVPLDPTTNGFMSFNKDLAVITATVGGLFNLNIFAK
jgi:Fibronectin type III domain